MLEGSLWSDMCIIVSRSFQIFLENSTCDINQTAYLFEISHDYIQQYDHNNEMELFLETW